MKHGSLFSGIGGFDLAAQWMGWENVFQVEWDKYCQRVLEKNFPNVKRYGDIKEFDGTKYRGLVDIISGGFPCQPFSHAGKRKGQTDDRYLWPEMLRVIGEIKPSYIVGENVNGLVSMANGETLGRILSDMEGEGYQTEQFIIPACGVGMWHRRDRIWIIAYYESKRAGRIQNQSKEEGTQNSIELSGKLCRVLSNTNGIRGKTGISRQEQGQEGITRVINNSSCKAGGKNIWSIEPSVGRVANGIPHRVDRLKGLGNAIVPQVAYQIFKAIEEFAISENEV